MVVHIAALDFRVESAWNPSTRAETAVDRAAAVVRSGGDPRR